MNLVIVGGGGHAKVVMEIAELNGYELVGFVDDDPAVQSLGNLTKLGDLRSYGASDILDRGRAHVVAIGDNGTRRNVADMLAGRGARFVTLVHPRAIVSTKSEVAEGTVVMAGAIISPFASVGRHTIVNSGCVVEHDDVIGDYAHISPGANLAGRVSIGEGTHIGIGSNVLPSVTVGSWCTVGGGTLVNADLPDGVKAYGVPARIVNERDDRGE